MLLRVVMFAALTLFMPIEARKISASMICVVCEEVRIIEMVKTLSICKHTFCYECLHMLVDEALAKNDLMLLKCFTCGIFWELQDMIEICDDEQMHKIANMWMSKEDWDQDEM